MQSIYFFREADAELFPRVKAFGLEFPKTSRCSSTSFLSGPTSAPRRLWSSRLNEDFDKIFALPDGSGVTFSSAEPMRVEKSGSGPRFALHLDFVPRSWPGKTADPEVISEQETARAKQIDEIVDLIRGHLDRIEEAKASGEKYRIAVLARAHKALAPIAQALRKAQIPFRAVDLEKLKDRPEVLDALALARALLNPHDRVAWLGVLRAPWCGLALEDLHRLTSADDPRVARAARAGVARRAPAASERAGQHAAATRTWRRSAPCLNSAPRSPPHRWEPGSNKSGCGWAARTAWMQPRAPTSIFCGAAWTACRAAKQELLGPALAAALDKLTALPDPGASSDCGVQLMTIHKSKGLEFEVVIVPEMQAGEGRGKPRMLTWLERGLDEPDDSGEITEFLVAPFQPKGADRGKAKEWVDHVYRERERQETRRILYVAATRAREELHLFARPAYKWSAMGVSALSNPQTACWPQPGRRSKKKSAPVSRIGRPPEPLRRPTWTRKSNPSPPPARAISLRCRLWLIRRCCAACPRTSSPRKARPHHRQPCIRQPRQQCRVSQSVP